MEIPEAICFDLTLGIALVQSKTIAFQEPR
jgi:hypothetical protein